MLAFGVSLLCFCIINSSEKYPNDALSFSTSDSPKALKLSELEQVQVLRSPRGSQAAKIERIRRQTVIENHNRNHVAIPLELDRQRKFIIFQRDITSPHERINSEMQPILQLNIQKITRDLNSWNVQNEIKISESWTETHHLPRGAPEASMEILSDHFTGKSMGTLVTSIKCGARMLYRQIEEWPHYQAQEETIKIKDIWTIDIELI